MSAARNCVTALFVSDVDVLFLCSDGEGKFNPVGFV